MATGLGGDAGRAIILNYDQGTGAYGPMYGSQTPPPPTAFPDMPVQDYGIQLDAGGMDDLFWESMNAMKAYANAAAAHGVNVEGVPDPRNPHSRHMMGQWRRAKELHMANTERLRQAKQNQDLFQKMFLQGKVLGDQGMFDPSAGPLTYERMLQEVYPTVHPFVNNANSILNRTPRNRQEYDELVGFREGVLMDIDDMVRRGEMNPDAAEYYRGKVAPVKTLEDRLLRSQLKTEQSRRAANYARAKSYDKPPKGKAGNLVAKYPELVRLAEFMTATSAEDADKARNELGSLVSERKLRDGKNVGYRSVRRGEGGSAQMFFSPDEDAVRMSQRIFQEEPDGKPLPSREPTSFEASDITPAMKNFLLGAKYEQFLEDMQEVGIMDASGRIDAQRVMDYVSGMDSDVSPGDPQSTQAARNTRAAYNNSYEEFKSYVKTLKRKDGSSFTEEEIRRTWSSIK